MLGLEPERARLPQRLGVEGAGERRGVEIGDRLGEARCRGAGSGGLDPFGDLLQGGEAPRGKRVPRLLLQVQARPRSRALAEPHRPEGLFPLLVEPPPVRVEAGRLAELGRGGFPQRSELPLLPPLEPVEPRRERVDVDLIFLVELLAEVPQKAAVLQQPLLRLQLLGERANLAPLAVVDRLLDAPG